MDNIDFIRDIVKTYEQRTILWDGKHPEFYNKTKRETEWQDFATEFGIPVLDLKKKIQSLTGSYRREKSRIRKSLRGGRIVSNGASGAVYIPRWFAFKWFKFLEKGGPMSVEGDAEQVSPNTENQEIPRNQAPSILRKRIVAKRRHYFPLLPTTLPKAPEELKRLPTNQDQEDEFDAFARNVALQLKQLPLIHALESQELIQRVLKEQRIKALRDPIHQSLEAISNDDNYSVTLIDNCTLSETLDKQQRDPLSFCNSIPVEIAKSEPSDL